MTNALPTPPTSRPTRDYLTCAETAKLLRNALRLAFPGITFSVRSHTYSMGASINVSWTDGPTEKAVETVTGRYEGADFDGSIDLKSYCSHYLLPDGSVQFASTEGTEGSKGYIPAEHHAMPEGARRVRFGADSIFVRREFSAEASAIVTARAAFWGQRDQDDAEREHRKWEHFHRAARELDFSPLVHGGKPILRPLELNAI